MARFRRKGPDPLASLPAELDTFDPREWAAPGEDPSEAEWLSQYGDPKRAADWWACHQRHSAALTDWFKQNPDADFLTWIRGRRARRRAAGGSIGP